MRAAVAVSQNSDDPLSGLELKDVPKPEAPSGWVRVRVVAASLNLHDIWTLRGVGHPADRLPIILGCDAAGVTDDGREVIVHPVLGDPAAGGGDITLDPGRALLSERIDGAFADYLIVPEVNVVDKPSWLSFEQAAALPVAWGTAYRMLFTRAQVKAGDRVLVQGASGGVASAAISLAAAAGARVYATGRSREKRDFAISCGAFETFEPGARLPEKVDVVVETVGEATWSHSLRSLRPGGMIVIAGATSGAAPSADLNRMFYLQQSVVGSTGCTRSELESLLRLMEVTGVRPPIDRVISFEELPTAFASLIDEAAFGKIIVSMARPEG
jgi:NADPH:quinone reductase-like Zn-dependent oxidoreductase